MNPLHMKQYRPLSAIWYVSIFLAVGLVLCIAHAALAQQQANTQIVNGSLETRSGDYYLVPNLTQGQLLTVEVNTTSGNLDPVVGILDSDINGESLLHSIQTKYASQVATGSDPVAAASAVADSLFTAWNDDRNGDESSASLTYRVPTDGDYHLLVLSGISNETFGNYRMVISLEPVEDAADGSTTSSQELVQLESKIPATIVSVDEIEAVYREGVRDSVYQLRDLSAGDTVYAYVETITGTVRPVLELLNYREKPLLIDNFDGASPTASLQFTVNENTDTLKISIGAHEVVTQTAAAAAADGTQAEPQVADGAATEDATAGASDISASQYRLLVGINDENVLDGSAQPTQRAAVVNPKQVEIGVHMDQIANVDQVSENYTAVVELRLEWTDPKLAFDPDECQCAFQTFTPAEFDSYMTDAGVEAWPVTTLFNQQGRRDEQGNTIVLTPDGHAIAVLRFTATFQAPDFDFRLFPFDKQVFHIRARSVFPEEFFIFTDLPNYSGLGDQLGEEEWVITKWDTSVDTSDNRSRFNFTFYAQRHIDYYLYRIFLPLLIIIAVSWAIFFLRNYEKRVDAAAANLLLLVAFNFTISGNLPKLGYLTLMDIVLITTFVVTGLVLVLNVFLRRLEVAGKGELAHRLDTYVLWFYPLIYIIFIGGIGLVFLARS